MRVLNFLRGGGLPGVLQDFDVPRPAPCPRHGEKGNENCMRCQEYGRFVDTWLDMGAAHHTAQAALRPATCERMSELSF